MSGYIFTRNGDAESAYVLKEGEITIELGSGDSFTMSRENLIFGAIEILLSKDAHKSYPRIFNLAGSPSVKYVSIAADKLFNLSHTYNIGFALARSVAEHLVQVNRVFSEKKKKTNEKEKRSQEYCKVYAWTIDLLESLYAEKRFPWLEEIIVQGKKALAYHKGNAFALADYEGKFAISGEMLDDFNQFFPPDATLCEEGDEANSLYILQKGKIDIIVGQNRISQIQEPGTVIGEMALLLGGKRNATMKVVSPTTVTVIHQNNLVSFIQSHPDFLENIAITLAKRTYHNIHALESLHEWIEARPAEQSQGMPELHSNEYKEEIKHLQSAIKKLYDKYNMDWIQDILDQLLDRLLRIQ